MSEKFEDQLNLALETEETVRLRTEDLNVGYEPENHIWELIVKYHGSLEKLKALGIGTEELMAGYAILRIPEKDVEALGAFPEIEYVEKPKKYYYGAIRPTEDDCIRQVVDREPFLSGKGVLIAVLDSGVQYDLPVFLDEEGNSRILALWDQSLQALDFAGSSPPKGFEVGVEFTKEQLDAALKVTDKQRRFALVPSVDVTGHGTAVAGIAAGSKREGYSGVASEASLLIVKLGPQYEDGFPGTTQIMRGVVYALRKAEELEMPLVINLSFGNSYGDHKGSSLLERFLDNAAEIGRTVICVGSGNEGDTAGHYRGSLWDRRPVQLFVAEYEQNLNLQLWSHFEDDFLLEICCPSGQKTVVGPGKRKGKTVERIGNTELLIYVGEPVPYSGNREIYVEFLPAGQAFLDSGIWEFMPIPTKIRIGFYSCYLPAGPVKNENTVFAYASPEGSFTVPSTAGRVITVGAYDPTYNAYGDFSGRGFSVSYLESGRDFGDYVKPDVVAPGVEILAPGRLGSIAPHTGTSFATPIVSGTAALLLEWGVVKGKDPYLYGEKMKAYLRAGAKPLRGEGEEPNERVGFGAVCTDFVQIVEK